MQSVCAASADSDQEAWKNWLRPDVVEKPQPPQILFASIDSKLGFAVYEAIQNFWRGWKRCINKDEIGPKGRGG